MRLKAAFLFLASIVPTSWAILSDEAYQIDYHHALLGTPQARTTFFHRPSSSSEASLLYTLSEKLILGAVNPKDGAIVWRQNLSDYSTGPAADKAFLRAVDGEDAVVSASGSDVSSWGSSDGKLLWTNTFSDEIVLDLELVDQREDADGASHDSVVVSGGKNGVVRRLDGGSGAVKWEYKDQSDDAPFQVSISSTNVYYISLQSTSWKGYKIKVLELDLQTGKPANLVTLSTETELLSPESIIHVGSDAGSPVIVWGDKDLSTLKVNVLGSKAVHTVNVENSSDEPVRDIRITAPPTSNAPTHFLINYLTERNSWADVYHVDVKAASISRAYHLPALSEKSVFSAASLGDRLCFIRITRSELQIIPSASEHVLEGWVTRKPAWGSPLYAVSEVVKRGETWAVRFAHVDEAGDWALVRNRKLAWRRHESLTDAIIATWADVNGAEALAHELDYEGHQDILTAYVHRLIRHAKGLQQNLPAWLQELPVRIISSFLSNEATDLNQFGFGKLALVATRKGRLLALDTARQGAVVWSTKLAEPADGPWGAKAISAEHGIATVFVNDGSSVNVNITTGETIGRQPPGEKYSSISLIPDVGSVTVQPDGAPVGPLTSDGSKFVITLAEDGRVRGFNGASLKSPAWEFAAPEGQQIVRATARPAHDPVASIGKVLGNRSVLYKYINPNVALLTAVADSTVTFYILDGVSGHLLHTTTQNGVDTSQPIASVISENWFAYSFWADVTDTSESKGYRLVTSEMFESPIPNDRGVLGNAANYSGIHNIAGIPRPHVISQAYIIPEPISNMAVTQTRQGITIKELLCTLPASNAIVGIPRPALDPRRPVGRDPTPQEAEEGLMRYMPYFEFDPKWYLNHEREVLGIKHIESSPTLLESSTLVFAYGFDVFGTRLAPSQPFDVLGKGFSKIQLLLTVIALGGGVSALAPMARAKRVNMMWNS